MNKVKQYIKNQAKIQLWRMGHRVKDMAGIPGIGYDLLVDDKIRLAVKTEGSALPKDCDVAVDIKGKKTTYSNNTSVLEWKRPTEIFGRKEKRQGKP